MPVQMPLSPGTIAPSRAIKEKFQRLAQEWREHRGPHASSARLAMHPAYQKIIGMGPEVVPLILMELKSKVESWFWALSSITDTDPVKKENQGDGEAMAKDWIEWGQQQGYQL